MTTTDRSRLFANGDAATLYLTIPARLTTDSQFPFADDDAVTVTVDDGRIVVAPASEGTNPEEGPVPEGDTQ